MHLYQEVLEQVMREYQPLSGRPYSLELIELDHAATHGWFKGYSHSLVLTPYSNYEIGQLKAYLAGTKEYSQIPEEERTALLTEITARYDQSGLLKWQVEQVHVALGIILYALHEMGTRHMRVSDPQMIRLLTPMQKQEPYKEVVLAQLNNE